MSDELEPGPAAAEPLDRAERAALKRDKAQSQQRDREAVWADIAADTARTAENTARLKALRLAREEAEAARAAAEAAAKPSAKASAKSKASAPKPRIRKSVSR